MRYPDRESPALDGVDLVLRPGRRLALVGESGTEATVANLLLRFLDPAEGRVAIAGRDAREYRQEDVRRTFAIAGNAHVFDATIRANSSPAPRPPTASSVRRWTARDSPTGSTACPTGSRRSSARTGAGSRADSASGARSPARSWRTRPC